MKKIIIVLSILFTTLSLSAAPPVRPYQAVSFQTVTNIGNCIDNDLQSYAIVRQSLLALNATTAIEFSFQSTVTGLFQIDMQMTTGLLSQINEDNLAQGMTLDFYNTGGQLVATYSSGGFVVADVLSISGRVRLLAFVNTPVAKMTVRFKKLAGILSSDINIFNVQNQDMDMNLSTNGIDNSAGLLHGSVLNPERATDLFDPNTEYASFQFPLISLIGNTSALYDWLPAFPAGTVNGEQQSVYLTVEGATPLTLSVLGSLNIKLNYTDNSSATYAISDPVVHVSIFQGTNKRLVEVPMDPAKSLKNAAVIKSDLVSVSLLNNMRLYNIFTGASSTISVLPVTLSSFTGVLRDKAVQLAWKVESMDGTVSFEVQRSGNGKDFSAIGSVHAGNSYIYGFTDNAPLAGVSYYRLRMIDADGSFAYTAVVMIRNTKDISISVLPNPAQDFIRISASVAITGVAIADAAGKPVISIASFHGEPVNISLLKPGAYFVRATEANGESVSVKIIKN
jgi:hypothetical protein